MFDELATSPDPSSQTESPRTDASGAERYLTCRWYTTPDAGPGHCTHRDVLPYAGTTGFKAEAWCPDCTFYKVRRSTKKRGPDAG